MGYKITDLINVEKSLEKEINILKEIDDKELTFSARIKHLQQLKSYSKSRKKTIKELLSKRLFNVLTEANKIYYDLECDIVEKDIDYCNETITSIKKLVHYKG